VEAPANFNYHQTIAIASKFLEKEEEEGGGRRRRKKPPVESWTQFRTIWEVAHTENGARSGC